MPPRLEYSSGKEGSENPREKHPHALDLALEKAILNSEFVEAGNYGVVVRIDSKVFANEIQPALEEEGVHVEVSPDQDLAAKILKVYTPGQGVEEFKMQTKAFNLLRGQEGLAHVPTPLFVRDVPINEEARAQLKIHGAHVDDTAELLGMDFIRGKDLATLMYEHVLIQKGYVDLLPNMTLEDKKERAGALLGFANPGGKSRGEDVRAWEERMVFGENGEKLIHFLRQTGFKLPEGSLDILERTVTFLHKNGLFHNDLHERNILFGDDGNLYLIDYGQAADVKKEDRSDDLTLIRRWRKSEVSLSQEDEMRIKAEKNHIDSFIKAFKAQVARGGEMGASVKEIQKTLQALKKAVLENDDNSFATLVTTHVASERDFDILLVSLKMVLMDDTMPSMNRDTLVLKIKNLPSQSVVGAARRNKLVHLIAGSYFETSLPTIPSEEKEKDPVTE